MNRVGDMIIELYNDSITVYFIKNITFEKGWTIEYGGTETSYYDVTCSVKKWTKAKDVWSIKENCNCVYRCNYWENGETGVEVDLIGEFENDRFYECCDQQPIYMVRNKDRFKDNVSVFEKALLPSDLFGGMEVL
jgi:hypothetical protein